MNANKISFLSAAVCCLGALVSLHAGCEATSEEGVGPLSERQMSELAEHGVAKVIEADGALSFVDVVGEEIGIVAADGPLVEVLWEGEVAVLHRAGAGMTVQCLHMAEPELVDDSRSFDLWLAGAKLEESCATAVRVGQIATEIDTAHQAGCAVKTTESGEALDCSGADSLAQTDDFRTYGLGCGCQTDGFGYCEAGCFGCNDGFGLDSVFCEDDPWNPGGGGGSGSGGGWGECQTNSSWVVSLGGGEREAHCKACYKAATGVENPCGLPGRTSCSTSCTDNYVTVSCSVTECF